MIEGDQAEEINNEIRRMVFRDKVPLRSDVHIDGAAWRRAMDHWERFNGKA